MKLLPGQHTCLIVNLLNQKCETGRLGEFSTVADVVVYVSSVANPRKHARKIACLEAFAEGARTQGASVVVEWENRYTPSHLAVILGWATTNTGGRNIELRKQIIAEQQRMGRHTMCIDASCFKYLDDHGSYLRYSLGGPFYDKAEYANHGSSADHWQRISNDLKIVMAPPKLSGDYILLCMQRDGGFAMKSLDPTAWINQKIIEIRQHSNLPIMIRPHPGTYASADFSVFRNRQYRQRLNVHVLDPLATTLKDNLAHAHAAVVFNSSASVAAVLAGVPVFADDSSCVSWAVANHDIAQINTPQVFDRTQWAYDLAAAHWSDDDARNGSIYQKFLPFLKTINRVK